MAFADYTDVERRLEDEPTERMRAMIEEALEDASDLARDYGDPTWDDISVPARVRRIVAAAVARWVVNPEGLTLSRAADESLGWSEQDEPGAIRFTEDEKARLARYKPAAMAAFGSIEVSNWGTTGQLEVIEYAPWAHEDNKPFPFAVVHHPSRRHPA